MTYSKPEVFPLLHGAPSPACQNGSVATTDGCATGPNVGAWCSEGNGNDNCVDGSFGVMCAAGTSPLVPYTRCHTGDTVG